MLFEAFLVVVLAGLAAVAHESNLRALFSSANEGCLLFLWTMHFRFLFLAHKSVLKLIIDK